MAESPPPDAGDAEPGPAAGVEPEPDAGADAGAGAEPAAPTGAESEHEPDAEPSAGPELDPELAAVEAALGEDVSLSGLMDALRQAKVGELLLSTVSTLASVAYGKLEASDLPEAKLAIDGMGAILPLLSGQIDAAILRDFESALTNLRLAYADAVAGGQ